MGSDGGIRPITLRNGWKVGKDRVRRSCKSRGTDEGSLDGDSGSGVQRRVRAILEIFSSRKN